MNGMGVIILSSSTVHNASCGKPLTGAICGTCGRLVSVRRRLSRLSHRHAEHRSVDSGWAACICCVVAGLTGGLLVDQTHWQPASCQPSGSAGFECQHLGSGWFAGRAHALRASCIRLYWATGLLTLTWLKEATAGRPAAAYWNNSAYCYYSTAAMPISDAVLTTRCGESKLPSHHPLRPIAASTTHVARQSLSSA